jgi:hypothetical protein
VNFAKVLVYKAVLGLLRSARLGTPKPAAGVVLFKPDRIGDFVLGTGLVRLCCDLFRGRPVVLVTSSLVAPLARRELQGIQVVKVPYGKQSLRGSLISSYVAARRALRDVKGGILVSICYHPTLYEDLLLEGFGSGASYGCAGTDLGTCPELSRSRRFRPTHEFDYPKATKRGQPPLELEAHRRLGELIAGRPVSLEEVWPGLRTFQSQGNGTLLVLPRGSQPVRDYPPELLASAIALAKLPPHAEVRICGEESVKGELENLAASITRRSGHNNVRLVCPGSVLGLAEEIAASQCVLTMESAGAHLATALDKPAVIILGGGHFGLFSPWQNSARQRWLWRETDCYNCDWECRHSRPLCITGIPAERIGACIHELWQQT